MSTKDLVALSDGRKLELSTGRMYAADGSSMGQYAPDHELTYKLSQYAAFAACRETARQERRSVTMRQMRGDGEHLVTMDLSPTDVHQDSPLANYAAGYRLAEGIADVVCPVIPTAHRSDKYYTWSSNNAFQRVLPNTSSFGADTPEVSPGLSNDSFSTVQYALGSFVPTEVESNADAPLRPYQAAVDRVMNALRVEREARVATLMTNSSNYAASNVVTLNSGTKWNGGTTSDPVANIYAVEEASYAKITGIGMSRKAYHAFIQNSQVLKYIAYKPSAAPIPDPGQISALLQLPPIYVADMKYAAGSTPTYVWGNDVILFHHPAQNPPTDGMDVSTAYTFRWSGAGAPDAQSTVNGWLVRSYFDPKRGGRGGRVIVVVHNDAEKSTSTLVGGVIKNALA